MMRMLLLLIVLTVMAVTSTVALWLPVQTRPMTPQLASAVLAADASVKAAKRLSPVLSPAKPTGREHASPGYLTFVSQDASIPGWRQVNTNGFGDPSQSIGSLAVHGSYLYAGTFSESSVLAAQVWRTNNGTNWTQFTPPWSLNNDSVYDCVSHGAFLYVGTSNSQTGGEVWRTNGTTWEQVVSGGFGNKNNSGINALAVFGGDIYAVTSNYVTGAEVWRSSVGDSGSWSRSSSEGFGAVGATGRDLVMDVLAGQLYVGLSREVAPGQYRAELWRSSNGTHWVRVFGEGLGNPANTAVCSLEEFDGVFYLGMRNLTTGGQVWRSSNGTSWAVVVPDGLGNVNNSRPYGLIAFANHLYLIFSNTVSGAEVWRTHEGTTWQPVITGGWGDTGNSFAAYYDKAATEFAGSLYIGTINEQGGEIWQMLHTAYLPLVRR